MTALQRYIDQHGPEIKVRGRKFSAVGIDGDDDLALATFRAVRAEYTGVLCVNSQVIGKPGAEVWSILAGKREIARFAVHEDQLISL